MYGVGRFLGNYVQQRRTFIFYRLASLAVVPFGDVYYVCRLAGDQDMLRVFKRLVPVLLPKPSGSEVLFTPFFFRLGGFFFYQFFVCDLVGTFRVLRRFLLVFKACVFSKVAGLVCGAGLCNYVKVGALSYFEGAFRTICANCGGVFGSAILGVYRCAGPRIYSLVS